MSLPREVSSQLWDKYRQSGDAASHETLVLSYAPWVKYMAGRMAIGLGGRMETEELVNCGIIGLIDAIERFDFSRGVKFETYALSRIKGAMIDGIRAMDWVPRAIREKAGQLEKTMAQLEMKLGRFPSDSEISHELGLSVAEYQSLLSEVSIASVISLEEPVGERHNGTNVSVMDTIPCQASPDPLREAEFSERKESLSRAISFLPVKERAVIALYYYEDLTLKEISLVLGVSESRVSQLHTKAIFRLRGHLGKNKRNIMGG